MVPVTSLAIPIVVSAVIVFLASSIIHMLLTYHRSDYKKLAAEDELLETLRRLNVAPGDYFAPHASSPAAMKDPGFVAKMTKGPLVVMTVAPGSPPAMGAQLAMWFVYCLVVNLFAGYIAGRALAPGEQYLQVFRFVGTTAFMGYALAVAQHSIWYRRDWGTTLKVMFDGLVYGLLTAGTFGWLWPKA